MIAAALIKSFQFDASLIQDKLQRNDPRLSVDFDERFPIARGSA